MAPFENRVRPEDDAGSAGSMAKSECSTLMQRKAPIGGQIDTRISTQVPLHSLRGVWLLVVLAFLIHEAGCSRTSRSDLQESLRHAVVTTDTPRFVLRGEAETLPWKETRGFYRKRNFQPAWIRDSWFGGSRVNAQATKLLTCLRDATQEGWIQRSTLLMNLSSRSQEPATRRHPRNSSGWTQN